MVLYLYRIFVLLPRDSYYRILFYLDLSFIHGSWRTTCIAGTGRKHCRLLIAVNWYCEHKLVYELKNLLGRAEQDDNSRRVSCLLHQRFKHGGCPIRPGLWNSEPTEEDMHQTWCVDLEEDLAVAAGNAFWTQPPSPSHFLPLVLFSRTACA